MCMQDLENRIVASRAMTVTVVAIVSVVKKIELAKKQSEVGESSLASDLTQDRGDPCKTQLMNLHNHQFSNPYLHTSPIGALNDLKTCILHFCCMLSTTVVPTLNISCRRSAHGCLRPIRVDIAVDGFDSTFISYL